MDVTRRNLFAAMAASALTAAAEQEPPSPAADEEITAARARLERAAEVLRRVEVSLEIEPAFQFEA